MKIKIYSKITTVYRLQRAWSMGRRAKSEELRAKSGEQRAKSKERRAEGKEQIRIAYNSGARVNKIS